MDKPPFSEEQFIEVENDNLMLLVNEMAMLLKMGIDETCDDYQFADASKIDFILILNNHNIQVTASSHHNPKNIQNIIEDLHEKLKTHQAIRISEFKKNKVKH